MDATKVFIDVLMEAGRIELVEIPLEVTDALFCLPEYSDDYFSRTAACELVSMELLVASHIRNEGVINANKLMRMAAQNKTPKRMPVRIRRLGSKFLVLDGNSTFVNARFSNWRSLLCEIVYHHRKVGS